MTENTDFIPPADPWQLFREWYVLAEANEPNDPNAMSLATIGDDNMPSVRVLLMKGFDERGFVFFTNRRSRKGWQLAAHPKAALCLHWKSLRRQVRAEGLITEVSEAESDAYHVSRPRGSQLGAWASLQSQPLADRTALEREVAELEEKFEGKPVPRPPHWGGYRLAPTLIEFWQDRPYRLHDRIQYTREERGAWKQERLYP